MQKQSQILTELREIKDLLQLNQPVLSLRQFCRFADISENYAYKLTSSGKLKFYRPFGKKIYVDRDEAIELLKQNPVSCKKGVSKVVSNYFLNSKNVA